MLTFSQTDQLALDRHGLSPSAIEAQLQQLRQGAPPLHLVRPCHIGDGIIQLSHEQAKDYHKYFHSAHAAGRISKFIPASGAATRMFKDMLQFIEQESSSQSIDLKNTPLSENMVQCCEQFEHFPFFENLRHYLKTAGIDFQDLWQRKHLSTIFQALLQSPGLDYAHLPKALLPFHQYPDGTRTSLEEHVHEALLYAHNATTPIRIHLTVSAQFETPVKQHLKMIHQNFSQNGIPFELTVSIQKSSTDTIALDTQGGLFRDGSGSLVFRPGGHGALLENLNEYQGDIVCISNIDNVVPDHLKAPIIEWRKTLVGYLIALQDITFQHLKELESPQTPTIKKVEEFVQDHLHDQLPPFYDQWDISEKAKHLSQFLNRPFRVCGVVANTGDAGGGPFWVQHTDGFQSRQIVEQSQADPESAMQQELFTSATHFNPVDMICGVRDYQNNPFDLLKFRDPETSFIAQKTYQGRPLKALEWPGLWNGGMANWITLFLEVPRFTFNPVKTFMDWLQPSHQPPS